MFGFETGFPTEMDMGKRPILEYNEERQAVSFAVIEAEDDLDLSDYESALDVIESLHKIAIGLSAEDYGVIYPIFRVDNLT